MTKQAQFHQAQIAVLVRIIDGDKSDGLRQFQTGVLLNTDAEWVAVREQIDEAIAEIQKELDDAAGN